VRCKDTKTHGQTIRSAFGIRAPKLLTLRHSREISRQFHTRHTREDRLQCNALCYISVVKCVSNRRLISRFRTGCHGLRVNTGRWADGVHLDRTDRLCLVCKSLDCVEDKQHFVFDCPAYSHIRSQHLDLLQHCCAIADFMSLCEPNACGDFLRKCFACRKQILTV